MDELPRLYLDNAATSFPKPPGVYDAMMRYATAVGASPGRGQYAESREGARLIAQCRDRIARLVNAERPDHVVFALNTSDALNLAIKGIARRWRRSRPNAPLRVVTTAMDHNSVLRPFQALAEDGAEVVHVPADADGAVDPAAVAHALTPDTALLAVNMASNVTGTIQPVARIGEIARARGVPYLVDAAQALGHIPVDVQAMHIDLLAFPGHKGLMGPQGTGGLYISPACADRLATTREGGTGSWSEDDHHPASMPERFEAGSHNTVGLVGLSEAVRWILDRGVPALREHELSLSRRFLRGLRDSGARCDAGPSPDGPLGAWRLLGPADPQRRVAVFALVHDELTPHEAAAALESGFGILARAGLTCAPRAHAATGTIASGGALRVSFGPFVTERDVDRTLDALAAIGPPGLVAPCPGTLGVAGSDSSCA